MDRKKFFRFCVSIHMSEKVYFSENEITQEMEGRVLNRAARDQEFIMNVERASGEKASDYESNEAFLEHIASNVYDNIIEIVHSLLKKEDEDWESYADRLCCGEHESVYSYMEWWNYSAFLWDRRDHENSNSVI